MKIKYKEFLEQLQAKLGFRPTHALISKYLCDAGKNVTANALSNRLSNNGYIDDEEQSIINMSFGTSKLEKDSADTVEIEYIRINPSCGKETIVMSEADTMPIKIGREIIRSLWNTAPENLKIFKASGDSMQEIINNGDLLLVDTSKTDYINGGIFLLTINNDWFIKRLRLRVTGELDIISDNTKYPIETLQPNTDVEINVKGRVIKNLSRGL